MKKEFIKVAVGLSGGVDSSVAAFLLKEQGYDITGVYIQCWEAKADGCSAEEDRASAVSVAGYLNIKFNHLNFIKEYEQRVISHFYEDYKNGRTPNPDILCNKEIKFGMFLDWAKKNGFAYIATGHYAKIEDDKLLRAEDKNKDQSYFLYRLTKNDLSKVIFPLGKLTKRKVREIAKNAGLPTFDRPDSQGICFVGKVNIKDFLKKELVEKTGDVIDSTGDVIGEHDGAWFYTIGQRHGFKVNKYYGIPLYVVGKNVEKNELVVGLAKDVLKNEFHIGDVHWINTVPKFPLCCEVRVRSLGKLHKCRVIQSTTGSKFLEVVMEEKAFALAPGQSAVLYLDDVVLGGGIIMSDYGSLDNPKI